MEMTYADLKQALAEAIADENSVANHFDGSDDDRAERLSELQSDISRLRRQIENF